MVGDKIAISVDYLVFRVTYNEVDDEEVFLGTL